jgi:hypothetical protein
LYRSCGVTFVGLFHHPVLAQLLDCSVRGAARWAILTH